MTAQEKRQKVADTYKTILGRNLYSQALRSYCFTKYSNGKYYSDCSSSVTYTYRKAGFDFGILNTVGIYNSAKLVNVPVTVKNGVIQNPEVLRVGDMLLFAGTDTSRAASGYVGHVEMVYKINGTSGAITICGHGSGTPRTTELNAYCRSRYAKKTGTRLGHKGLIRVRRLIPDDDKNTLKKETEEGTMAVEAVKPMPEAGATSPQRNPEDSSGAAGASAERSSVGAYVIVTGATVNLRKGAGKQYEADGIAKKGDVLDVIRERDGWLPVLVDGRVRWISEKYAERVTEDET